MGVQLKKGVQLNLSLFNILRTDLIVDFEGYYVEKKFIINEIAFFNHHLNTNIISLLKLKLLVFNESYQTIHYSLDFSSKFEHYKYKKF